MTTKSEYNYVLERLTEPHLSFRKMKPRPVRESYTKFILCIRIIKISRINGLLGINQWKTMEEAIQTLFMFFVVMSSSTQIFCPIYSFKLDKYVLMLIKKNGNYFLTCDILTRIMINLLLSVVGLFI